MASSCTSSERSLSRARNTSISAPILNRPESNRARLSDRQAYPEPPEVLVGICACRDPLGAQYESIAKALVWRQDLEAAQRPGVYPSMVEFGILANESGFGERPPSNTRYDCPARLFPFPSASWFSAGDMDVIREVIGDERYRHPQDIPAVPARFGYEMADCVRLLRVTREAIKANQPDEQVLGGIGT